MDAEANLRLGIAELRRRYGDLDISAVYQNAAIGFDGADFLNLVVGLNSDAAPADFQQQIEAIHRLTGRELGAAKFSSRPLDIDLLLYGDRIIDDKIVRIPRADVLEHGFVLRPLAELAPDLLHPVTGWTMASHWESFDQQRHPLTQVSISF